MKLVSVYPITLLPQKLYGPFSYFSKDAAPTHSLVEINFSGKNIPAIVVESQPLTLQKSKIKNNRYALKKISKIISPYPPFHPFLISIAVEMSKYSLEPVGSILKTFVSSSLLETSSFSSQRVSPQAHFQERQSEAVIGTLEERISHYKNVIREAFAKKKSVILFAPTVKIAEYLYAELSVFQKTTFLIHGVISKKNLRVSMSAIQNLSVPSLLIGTVGALGYIQGHEGVIIIEDADSRHYIRHERPSIHTTVAIQMIALEIQAKLITGKYFPSLEDLKNNVRLNYLSSRRVKLPGNRLVDLSKENFTPLSPRFVSLLNDEQDRCIIFTSRKGFYSFLVCKDCNTLVTCPTCKRSLVLHASRDRYYACHYCDKTFPTGMACKNCQSWNLHGYGMGTERVYKEIKNSVPSRPIWLYDEETAPTRKRQKEIREAFFSSRDSILVGTELILEDPKLVANRVLIAHIDNLFSVPDFKMNERILTLLSKLEERSKEFPLLLQTRFPQHLLFRYFLENNTKRLLEKELAERKQEALPPYTALVVVSFAAKNKKDLDIKIAELQKSLASFIPGAESLPILSHNGTTSVLISIEKTAWLKESDGLKKIFFEHIDTWNIVVDPDSII